MKIRIKTVAQFCGIATLTYVTLVLPAVAKDTEETGKTKDSGAPRTPGAPIGTWMTNLRWDAVVIITLQATITISADANARYRETIDIQYKPGQYIGMGNYGITPMKLMGKNHLRYTTVSSSNKVKRVGNDLYMYMTGKQQLVSSDSDPAGISFEDINAISDMGARKLKQTPNSIQTFAVEIYHIQGNNLVHEKNSRADSYVFRRVSSR